MSRFFSSLGFILLLFLFTVSVYAHESRPLYIQITEADNGNLLVKINIPNTVGKNNLPQLILPENFSEIEGFQEIRYTSNGYIVYYQYKGNTASLRGKTLYIKYPKFNPAITSFIQLNTADKKTETIVLGPEKQAFVIPLETSLLTVVKQYTLLGLNHIWSGFDHLLFVACLVFIAGFSKKLVYAITGFTLAHSITLFLAALNITNLPIPPVEACIALSILFLCYEIIHHHKDKTSLTYRFPIAVSSSFGLLHGFGFAGVLSKIGLPYESKIVGLLFFNIGVEIGQLLFIGLLLLLVLAVFQLPNTKLKQTFLLKSYKIGIYAVGILASYWLFERLLST